jgi:[protein-PII] uridylyltransferase
MSPGTAAAAASPPMRRRRRAEPFEPLADRDALRSNIEACIGRASPENARTEVLALLKSTLDAGRENARGRLDRSGSGLACAQGLSALQDEIIHGIHYYVTRWVYPANNPTDGEHFAVVAVGGYGRGTLAPGSDIDLLFLCSQKQTAWVESVVEAILYLLWDLRLKVGHSTRSIDECMRQARADMTVRTALLESRLILGPQKLFDRMRARFMKEIVRGTGREFVAAKLAERDTRLAREGRSRYLVEPNVKESKGGLRDLNTFAWIAKYVYRADTTQELVKAGVFTPREIETFDRCEEFLWRVRCHLHFLAGRAEERLSFDRQTTIATRLGYVAHSGLSAVERFMKHYFLVAKDVGDLSAIVSAALEAKQAKPPPIIDRFVRRIRRRRDLKSPDFIVEHDRITVARPNVFDKDPVNLLRLYRLSDEHGLVIHPDATHLVTRSLGRITAKVRNDPEANQLFLDVLASKNTPESVLRKMNESGVLGRFIPPFGRIVALMQFSMYHSYTVDEHLLQAIGVLSGIEGGRLVEDHPVASEILPSISNRTALYVALFLHDIAKGRDEDHSIAGARVAREICPRLGLNEAETDTVAWLVREHLVMSNTAQSRDLSDPKTIERFAGVVQTLERLKLLLVLTVCDIRAVGPGVWNGWKGSLLRSLYYETEVFLAGGHSAVARNQRVTKAKIDLRNALPAWSDADFEAHEQRLYDAYWLKVDLERKIRHANLLHAAAVEMHSLVTEVTSDAFRGVTELTVSAPDHPFLLSTIAGACAASSANIVDAHVFTTSDGFALDSIFITREFPLDQDEMRRGRRIAQTIERSLRGEVRLDRLMPALSDTEKTRADAFTIVPEVVIDNSLSNRYSVIEVSGLDRPGLLFDLTQVISRLNLNIGSAHILTFGEKAVDVFYVTDLTGAKLTNPSRQSSIKRHILGIFTTGDRKGR